MLSNEVFAIECRRKYEEQGLIVDKTNGQFAHCPYPKGMGDSGYYLLWSDHQHQGLLQSRDVGRRCFWTADAKIWLDGFPEGYFELCDIYQEFNSGKHHSMFGKTGELATRYGKKNPGASASMKKRTGELHPAYGKKRPDLSERNRKQAGDLHPMFGKTNPDLSERNRKRRGELHPMFGKKSPEHSERMSGELNPSHGKKWWVNNEGETYKGVEPPGPDWQHGRKWKVG